MKKLPIGIQSFSKIREEGLLYIDKTEYIHRLITRGDYYFLSRPRRFGKSLTLSTIKEIYQGNKVLFNDLWIEDNWDWKRRNPVIHISFSKLDYQGKGLEVAVYESLQKTAKSFGFILEENTVKSRFAELLQKLSEQGKVVLLIDEYDKPLIDYLDDLEKAKAHQSVLKSFYSVIKDSDPYIEFLLITGVSKFSKVSIFSDLNNLEDITLDWRYASMLGYNQQELEFYFEEHIKFALEKMQADRNNLLAKIKQWYNGYSWEPGEYVYNPFSILNFFSKIKFQNFWFSTGTPTFLVNLLREHFFYDMENVEVDSSVFESYSLDNMDLRSLLFQTGYLTIKHVDEFGIYTLSYPNNEVRESMFRHLIGGFRHEAASITTPTVIHLRKAFYNNNMPDAIAIVNSLFKSIPYQIFLPKKEAYYHSIIHLVFTYLGQFIESEVSVADGRIDAVVKTPEFIYVVEFKLDKSAQEAITQIKEKGYADRFRNEGRKLIGLGINFSSETKSVEGWKVLEL